MHTAKRSFFLFLLFLPICFAVDYPQALYDDQNSAASPLRNTWDQTAPTISYIPLNTNFMGGYEFVTPLVGNVDSDSRPEIFLWYANTYTGFEYTTNGLETEYTDLNNTVSDVIPASNGLLFDATGDGDYELFYCGFRANETLIVGYNWVNDTPQPLFELVVGDNTGHNLCRMTESGVPLTGNFSYDPLTYTDATGRYVLFFTGNTTDSRKGVDVRKIVAQNGSQQILNFRSAGGCTNGLLAPNVFSASFSSRPWNSLDGAGVASPIPSTSPAICPSGAYQRLYVPMECYKGTPTSGRGLMAIRMDTLVADTSFGTGGYTEIVSTTTQQQFSSPMCARGTTLMLGYDGVGQQTNMYEATASSISLVDQIDDPLAPNNEWVSDLFLAEMTSSSNIQYDDICFFQKDTSDNSLALYCTDVDKPLITDEVYARSNFAHTASPSRFVHTTSPGFSLTGDSRQEIITSFGIFTPEPSGFSDQDLDFNGEGFSGQELRNDQLYLPLIGTCIGADINNDGYGDVFCSTPTNLTLIVSTNINQPVDLKLLGVDVVSTMCPGNQSFFVQYNNEVGYSDLEQDELQFSVDCENNGTFISTSFVSYGTSFSQACPYDTGTHTAQIRLGDDGSGTYDTLFYTTTVTNITGCTSPDGLVSGTVDDAGDVGSDVTGETTDIGDDLLAVLPTLGIKKTTTREAVVIIIILLILAAIAYRFRQDSNIVVLLVVVGAMLLLTATLLQLIRPYIMVILTLIAIGGSSIYSAILGNQRQ